MKVIQFRKNSQLQVFFDLHLQSNFMKLYIYFESSFTLTILISFFKFSYIVTYL